MFTHKCNSSPLSVCNRTFLALRYCRCCYWWVFFGLARGAGEYLEVIAPPHGLAWDWHCLAASKCHWRTNGYQIVMRAEAKSSLFVVDCSFVFFAFVIVDYFSPIGLERTFFPLLTQPRLSCNVPYYIPATPTCTCWWDLCEKWQRRCFPLAELRLIQGRLCLTEKIR